MRLIAISMVSWSGILVKRLVTSFPLSPFPFPLTKFDKGNRDVILDWKLYDKAIQKSISDTAKFEKLDEDLTLKLEALLQRFLRKLKQRNFLNKNEYNKFYPFGSAPAYIYGTPKMHKFFSSDSFPKFRRIVPSIVTLSYNLACFLCDLVPP